MKELIKEIYDNYYLEKSADNSEERREALHKVVEKQKELLAVIGKKERLLLEEYESARTNLEWSTHKEAFIDGVEFGVRFIIDALR